MSDASIGFLMIFLSLAAFAWVVLKDPGEYETLRTRWEDDPNGTSDEG